MKVRHTLSDGTVIVLSLCGSEMFIANFYAGEWTSRIDFSDYREAIASFSTAVEDDGAETVFFRLLKRAKEEGYDFKTGRYKGGLSKTADNFGGHGSGAEGQ